MKNQYKSFFGSTLGLLWIVAIAGWMTLAVIPAYGMPDSTNGKPGSTFGMPGPAHLMPGNENPLSVEKVVFGRLHVADPSAAGNLEVAVYQGEGKLPAEPSHVLTPTGDGVFSFVPGEGEEGPFILKIHGGQGTGRHFLPYGLWKDTIHLTYPVVEEIVFLHTNDHHFDINLLEEFTGRVNMIREQHADVFLFDAGDVFVRHPHRWVEDGMPMEDPDWYAERANRMIRTMNDLGYDAMTLGNHEFDYVGDLTRQALELADFPLLSANVHVSTSQFPTPESHAVFYSKTGRRITVLGLSVVSGIKDGIHMHPVHATAENFMHLREGSDVFVALTHIGLESDVALAEEFPQIDVIIGGHSHHMIEEAVLVNGVLVAQAGGNQHVVSSEHPVYLGKVMVRLVNGEMVEKRGHVIFLAE